jgi:hypothetical protein
LEFTTCRWTRSAPSFSDSEDDLRITLALVRNVHGSAAQPRSERILFSTSPGAFRSAT